VSHGRGTEPTSLVPTSSIIPVPGVAPGRSSRVLALALTFDERWQFKTSDLMAQITAEHLTQAPGNVGLCHHEAPAGMPQNDLASPSRRVQP
jgi:hypothetical protein